MLLNSRSALATAGRALRGVAANVWRGGVSSGSVFMPTACVQYTSSVEHAWEAMTGSVPRREYASSSMAWRSWPGVGAARFSSSTTLVPEPDIVLTAMKSPAVREPGGLHATLGHLGLEEAVRFLPPELPRGSFPETAAALALACPSLPALLEDLSGQDQRVATQEIARGMKKLLALPSKKINEKALLGVFNMKPEILKDLLLVLLSAFTEDVAAAADAAAAAAKKRAEEEEAAAKRRAEEEATWASALSSAGVSNTVLPLREVLLDSAAGHEYMPETGHRQAVRHVLGWKLGLGEAMLEGKKEVLKWFEEAKAALQVEHGGGGGDASGAAGTEGASQHAMDITGLNPVFGENGEVVAFATRFISPVSSKGLKPKDFQQEYGICAATDDEAAPSQLPLTLHPKETNFIHLPAVRPRLDGTLEQLPRQALRTLSIVWTPERIAFLASCAKALTTEGPGHLLTGVHGCGKSTTLAALVSIAAVGLGADVLYVRNGGALLDTTLKTLLQGLNTSAGDALSVNVLHERMWPLLRSSKLPPQTVLNVLDDLFGEPGEEPLHCKRLVVVDEVNKLYRNVKDEKQGTVKGALLGWCDWDGRHEGKGTMRVLASSPDTILEETMKSQTLPVFYELGPTTTKTMMAVLFSGVDAELSLPSAGHAGVGGGPAIPTEHEVWEMLQYLGNVPRFIRQYLHDLKHMGHKQALQQTFDKLSDELQRRLERQLRDNSTDVALTWSTIAAATWGLHMGEALDGLANASMVSRTKVKVQRVRRNAVFVSLAARHALLQVLLSRTYGRTDGQRLSNLLGGVHSTESEFERDIVALLALGACGHRALAVGQAFLPQKVKQLMEYPQNENSLDLVKVVSPASVTNAPRLSQLMRVLGLEDRQAPQVGDIPPSQLALDSSVVPADVLSSLHGMKAGDAWVIQTWKNSPGVDALLVHHDTEVKHAVFVEVTSSNLYAHASGKGKPTDVPPGLRDIAQVALSKRSHLEVLEDGNVRLLHTGGSENAPASDAGGEEGSEGGMSVVNSWLELLKADVRLKAEQVSVGGESGAGQGTGDQKGSDVDKYKKLRVTAEPVDGVSKPEWRVHMLYVTNTDLVANKTYLEQCAKYLDSPLVHAMVAGDFVPVPAPTAEKITEFPDVFDPDSSDADEPSEPSG